MRETVFAAVNGHTYLPHSLAVLGRGLDCMLMPPMAAAAAAAGSSVR